MTAAWDRVAAPGTDPALLEAVVTCMAVDPAAFRTRLRAAVDDLGVAAALRQAVAASPVDLEAAAGAAAATWGRFGVRVALAGDPGYPRRLRPEHDRAAPLLIGWRGQTAAPDGPAVAIVGTRKATAYGRGVAAWLAEDLARAGVRIVSGGAVGIDAAAHAAAAQARGGTTVVLGCGHDVPYPRPHAAPGGLFDRVLDGGGALVSECLPGARPKAHRVRERNRIVAALVDAVVVVEGGARSGALLTASEAADRGVGVFAVPGDVRAPGSVAPHRLLAEGAGVVTRPADLLAALDVAVPPPSDDGPPTARADLPAPVATVLADRWPRPVDVESLARLAGVATGPLLASLTRARIAGTVVIGPDGVRLARSGR